MSCIELPRPVEAYFAFAELAPGRQGRRFTITFSYLDAGRVERLQWWWKVNISQWRAGGELAVEAQRREAIARFQAHIETWLKNSGRRLGGGDPFPVLGPRPTAATAKVAPTAPAAALPSKRGQAA